MSRLLVTGGAGFVGSNLTARLLEGGHDVVVLDSLARDGVRKNLEWLQQRSFPGKLHVLEEDIRDPHAVAGAMSCVETVYHLAAQVAVTTSVEDPEGDFQINTVGTFNVLQAARKMCPPPALVFTSTNKVYGSLPGVAVRQAPKRCEFADRPHGISEDQPLDFHSPYGCSKGAADQYVLDYARIYGIRTAVLRMSCIYGRRQFGNEDQGWVAHMVRSAVVGMPITVYGDGRQVRDLLYIDDLVDLLLLVRDSLSDGPGGVVWNVGGGPKLTLSILELFDLLEARLDHPVVHSFAKTRPGDQPVYISDIRKVHRDLGWVPSITVEEGLERLLVWVRELQR